MAQLQFKGKQFVQNHHLLVKYRELEPKKDKSFTNKVSLHDNLIVHGDNLDSLKALLPIYAGKVNCIYIDPPYNTGNEDWIYNDNVNSPMMQEWLGKEIAIDDLARHDKWLCMMLPRLKLLYELLDENGLIFISIDDNEVHHLKQLTEEIFGEDNVDICVWKKIDPKYDKNVNAKIITRTKRIHEFIIIGYKNKKDAIFEKIKKLPNWLNKYTNPDNDQRGSYKQGIISFQEGHLKENKKSECYYTITTPRGKKIRRHFFVTKREFDDLLSDNRIYFPRGGDGIPALKIFENEEKDFYFETILEGLGSLNSAKKELAEIFSISEEDVFDTPKPTKLIKEIIRAATAKDSIILDSFAGSGTTAQAVLELNKESAASSRRFILIEMEDYADKITAERVRRVIKGMPNSKAENLKHGLGGNFSYFELGKPIEMESILSGNNLPTYLELARYVFYTATGDEFDETKVNEKTGFIGETKDYRVYLFYKPDLTYLKNSALTLEHAEKLGKPNGKKRLVFAPTKYLDQDHLDQYKIEFAQLPFEIYK